MSKIVYISGPMSGLPDYNYPAFFAAEKILIAKGFETINPARTEEKADWNGYMSHAIDLMRNATAIYYLKGWENSFGARIEAIVAEKMKLEVVR